MTDSFAYTGAILTRRPTNAAARCGLPSDDLFHRRRLRLFKDALLLDEVVNAGTHMLFAHSLQVYGAEAPRRLKPALQSRTMESMRLSTAILMLACATACLADTLTLRNGQVVQGTYMGGTARTVKMQVDDTVKTYDVTDIATLQFTPPAPTASAARPAGGAAHKAPAASTDHL
jgi:hypothetical protein